MEDVTIDDVTATAEVSDSTSMYRVKQIEQKRRGQWVVIGRRQPAVAAAGGLLKLRATLSNAGVTHLVPLVVAVPETARRGGALQVSGGASVWDNAIYKAKTPAAMEEAVANMVRNDEVVATLHLSRRGHGATSAPSETQDLVVRGRKWADVVVRR